MTRFESMLLRLVRSAHAWVMLCTWQPFCRLLSLDLNRRKTYRPPRSSSLLQPADSSHTDCFTPKNRSLLLLLLIFFFTPLKLHHRGETATSVDYLSFLCYPMDIHCKADPFSAMHREYTEEVYNVSVLCLYFLQISSKMFASISTENKQNSSDEL